MIYFYKRNACLLFLSWLLLMVAQNAVARPEWRLHSNLLNPVNLGLSWREGHWGFALEGGVVLVPLQARGMLLPSLQAEVRRYRKSMLGIKRTYWAGYLRHTLLIPASGDGIQRGQVLVVGAMRGLRIALNRFSVDLAFGLGYALAQDPRWRNADFRLVIAPGYRISRRAL